RPPSAAHHTPVEKAPVAKQAGAEGAKAVLAASSPPANPSVTAPPSATASVQAPRAIRPALLLGCLLAGVAAAFFVVVGVGVAAFWLGTSYFSSRQGPSTTEKSAVAEEETLNWEELSSAEGNFKILMPGQPSKRQQPLGPPGPAGPGLPAGQAPVRVYYEART